MHKYSVQKNTLDRTEGKAVRAGAKGASTNRPIKKGLR